jgi:hypothetical protein
VHHLSVLANDRGWTQRGYDVPASAAKCRIEPWATTHRTDIEKLTLGCGSHHILAEHGWTSRKIATATPNGSLLPTLIAGSRGSTVFPTRKDISSKTMTMIHSSQRHWWDSVRNQGVGVDGLGVIAQRRQSGGHERNWVLIEFG